MTRIAAAALALLALTACRVIDVHPFTSGIYTCEEEEVWMQIRVEDREVVFYDSVDAFVDADDHIQGTELHRESFAGWTDEERGEACGVDYAYENAPLQDWVTFQLHTTWFSWPYLTMDCDETHLILSDAIDTMDCDIDGVCFYFAPLEE